MKRFRLLIKMSFEERFSSKINIILTDFVTFILWKGICSYFQHVLIKMLKPDCLFLVRWIRLKLGSFYRYLLKREVRISLEKSPVPHPVRAL
jgi:hypothetical protein